MVKNAHYETCHHAISPAFHYFSLLQSCPYTYHKAIRKERRYNLHSLLFLVLDEGGWSVSCPWPLYAGGKGHLCLLNRRLGRPHSISLYRRKRPLASTGIRTTDHPIHSLFTILTMLSQIPFLPFTSKYSTTHCILESPCSLINISFVSFTIIMYPAINTTLLGTGPTYIIRLRVSTHIYIQMGVTEEHNLRH